MEQQLNEMYHTLAVLEIINRQLQDCVPLITATPNPTEGKTANKVLLTSTERALASYHEIHFKFDMQKAAVLAEMTAKPPAELIQLNTASEMRLASKTETIYTLLHSIFKSEDFTVRATVK